MALLHLSKESFICPKTKLVNEYCAEEIYTVKPVISGHSDEHQKLVFSTDNCLMQVKSISECSKGSILRYF